MIIYYRSAAIFLLEPRKIIYLFKIVQHIRLICNKNHLNKYLLPSLLKLRTSFLFEWAGYGSGYSLACFAFERFLAIYWPLRMKRLLGLRFTLLLLLLPVFMAVLYFGLDLIMYRLFPQPSPIGQCSGDYTSGFFIIYVFFNECNSLACGTINIFCSFAVAIKYVHRRKLTMKTGRAH